MSLRTPLSRARGLGSAHEGVAHFWAQRVTAVALVPLAVWFIAALVGQIGADYETMRAFLAEPLVATLLILFVLAGFYHMKLGIQVVVEDYVHAEGIKIVLLILNLFFAVALGLVCVLSILMLALQG